ncbi:hypothetical protein BGZ65_001303 [Modicella reniformis]|uniref:Uncharacterized protein n=1 Tax=Modicella reniformis TaxID=1440133 RepID=A0A9P6J442_9FUNG|nr:hypothetical protein BGZ65_001303 [Modicella reniformis]
MIESRHIKSGYNNPNEATGLLFVKLIQVTNKATTKIFDVEWTLRVGNVERTSYPSRSFKDNPGNTATMNEVFLLYCGLNPSNVNEPFQLEMIVSGSPLPTKLGTIAGLSNLQTSVLGQLELSFCLEPLDKSVCTYKLRRPVLEDTNKSSIKSDCEVVLMIGLDVLEEPVEDRSWETATLYQGFLTFMTRSGRMATRDVMRVIPLAHILRVQPPDYEKVDVGANGFSMVANHNGVDMKSGGGQVDPSELDYILYAFTDSTPLHDVWCAHLEEAIYQYWENMARRAEIHRAKMVRRANQSLSRHSFESSVPSSPLETEDESRESDMIDLKYVW